MPIYSHVPHSFHMFIIRPLIFLWFFCFFREFLPFSLVFPRIFPFVSEFFPISGGFQPPKPPPLWLRHWKVEMVTDQIWYHNLQCWKRNLVQSTDSYSELRSIENEPKWCDGLCSKKEELRIIEKRKAK